MLPLLLAAVAGAGSGTFAIDQTGSVGLGPALAVDGAFAGVWLDARADLWLGPRFLGGRGAVAGAGRFGWAPAGFGDELALGLPLRVIAREEPWRWTGSVGPWVTGSTGGLPWAGPGARTTIGLELRLCSLFGDDTRFELAALLVPVILQPRARDAGVWHDELRIGASFGQGAFGGGFELVLDRTRDPQGAIGTTGVATLGLRWRQ